MRLIVRNMEKEFNKNIILNKASYTFSEGMVYGIFGKKGAGKTTFLNCISGECDAFKGDIKVAYRGLIDDIDYKDAITVFDAPVLPEYMTGYEYIKFYMDINKDKFDVGDNTPDDYLDLVKFDKTARYSLIKDYSLKMKNEILAAALYVYAPLIILMDEPFWSDDNPSSFIIRKVVADLKKDHIIIIATNAINAAKKICDEIIVLENGKMEGFGKKRFEDEKLLKKLKLIVSSNEEAGNA